MTMKRNVVAILLCLVLLSACDSNNASTSSNTSTSNEQTNISSEVAMGRYVEESLEFPSIAPIKLIRTEEGFETFGTGNSNNLEWYKSKDGTTWQKQEAPWIDELNKEENWIRDVSYDKDKNIYVSIMSDKSIIKVIEDGKTIKDVDIKWKGDSTYINSTYRLDNGDFLIIDLVSGAMRYDKDGNFVMDYPFSSSYDSASSDIFENKIVLDDNGESTIKIYNIDTGEVENSVSYKGLWEYNSHLAFGEDGSLYVANRLGVHRVVPDGSKFEVVVDGSMTSLGMPANTCFQTLVNNNEIWTVFYDGQFKHYTYSSTIPSKPTQEVSIYMLNGNTAMQQLAGEYQKNHPETKVNCNVAMDNQTGTTKSDIIRALNTELLAAKGPDLILLDGLPIDSYIEKGVLMDLKDIDISKLNPNVANTYKSNGNLYGIPLYYKIPTMWADNDIINTVKNLDDLVNWKNSHPDKPLFKSANYKDLIKVFYLTSAPYWLENKTIDEDKFKQFLKNIKDLQVTDEELEAQYTMFTLQDPTIVDSSEPYEFSGKNNDIDFAYGDFNLLLNKISSPSGIIMPVAAIAKRGENSSFGLGIGQAENIYEPSSILAVNANSTKKDIAKEIMELAISENVQDTNLYGLGLCINNNSLEKSFTEDTNKYGSFGSGGEERELIGDWPEEKYVNRWMEIIKQVKTPSTSNEILIQIILDETKGYFEDTKTLEEAVEAVSQRTQAYFTE